MITFDTLNALHIIAMAIWFAGTFHSVRLFVLRKEAGKLKDPEHTILQKHFNRMIRRSWYMVTWPALILLLVLGTWMLMKEPEYMLAPYMQIKLALVALLVIYHLMNQRMYKRSVNGVLTMSVFTLRLWGEITTLLLASIVFTVVLKTMDKAFGVLGVLAFAAVIYLGVFLFKHKKEKDIGTGKEEDGVLEEIQPEEKKEDRE